MSSDDLFDALETRDLDRLSSLLRAGADPDAPKSTPPGWAPLHEAIEQLEDGGPLESLVLLLRHGAAVEAGGGDTPLLMALYRERPDAALVLLARGANVNVRGPEGDSPLRVAVERGDAAMASTLLRCGAAATIDDAGAAAGASALGIAARRLDVALVELLLAWGANPAARDADRLTARERLPAETADNAERRARVDALLAFDGDSGESSSS